jgi:hypothetical protein
MEDSNVVEQAAERRVERGPLRMVLTYPPFNPGPGQVEMTFKRCFTVCRTYGGAKICATVCVNIHGGLSGFGGKVTATVSVEF